MTDEQYRAATEPFREFTWCLATYACNQQNTKISLTALEHLISLSEKVSAGEIGGAAADDFRVEPGSMASVKIWESLMLALVRVCWDPRGQLRGKAIDAFFALMQNHGHSWSSPLWDLIFSKLIFENLFGGLLESSSTYDCIEGHRCDRKDWLQAIPVTCICVVLLLSIRLACVITSGCFRRAARLPCMR